MSVSENEVARQVNAANLRQWQAVLGPDEWGRAWEAMAEPAAHPVSCDGCREVYDLEECIITRSTSVFCPKCRDARTDGGWQPEEFFEDGGEL